MICWFCFILLISSDNLSVGEESCESIIPWFLDPNSFRSILYHLHRLALESHNCNHHHSFPFSSNCNPYSIHCLISIKWTHSNSSQWSLFNRITLFRHLFPFYSPCNDPFWWITPHQNQSFNSWVKQSSSTLYFYHSSTHKIRSYPREVAHWFITYLAMGKTHITPNYCYSNKQVLSHSIHPRIRFA